MRVLITGATGHLGAWLARESLAEGWTVRTLVRPTSDLRGLHGLDVEHVQGDLLDPDSLARACEGQELVLHAAAVHRNWAPDPQDIMRPAIEGTENIVRAAAATGVRRLVHTSSNATIGYPKPDEAPWDESHHMQDPHDPYIRGKVESEARALALGEELGLDVVVCNPCGILGPWDLRHTPSTRSVLNLAKGDPSVIDVALTHAQDIARGHVLAAQKGVAGERYILAGDNLTKQQIADLVGELCGTTVKTMTPPRFLMRLLAWNEVRKARASGGDAGITGTQIHDVFGRTLHYDSSKARAQLGWTARPARDVVLDTLAWLAVQDALPDPVADKVKAARLPEPAWLEALAS